MHEANNLMVLVDDQDRVIGTGEKLDIHREGSLHRAFSVVIWNSAGELLLQKRNARKYHSGGLWTNACCGHPHPGEHIVAAARRRLEAEMGFVCSLEGLGLIRYRAELDHGMIEHELVHVFRGVHNGSVVPDPEEADGYEWSKLEDVQADIAAMPHRFSAWFREYMAAQWPVAPVGRVGRPDQSQG